MKCPFKLTNVTLTESWIVSEKQSSVVNTPFVLQSDEICCVPTAAVASVRPGGVGQKVGCCQ